MESSKFDRLARLAAAGSTRRRFVAIAAALAGGGAAVAAGGASAARVTCRPTHRSCTRGTQCCSGYCETSRTAPRRQRQRCGCDGGVALCGGACCTGRQRCVAEVCHGFCKPEAGAIWCTETVENEVIQDCGGESPGMVFCDRDSDCDDLLPYCGDPGVVCTCGVFLSEGTDEYFLQEPGFGIGQCSARFLVHPTLGCNWTTGGRSGGICGSASECISSAWDPANTACVSGTCVYTG